VWKIFCRTGARKLATPRRRWWCPLANTDRPRILCVDDDPNVRERLARTLRGHYVVETANEGTVAVEMLRTAEPVAVIMSDQRMRK